jgi:hypothetical protein
MVQRFRGADRAGVEQFLHQAVIARQLTEAPAAQQIGARVAGP